MWTHPASCQGTSQELWRDSLKQGCLGWEAEQKSGARGDTVSLQKSKCIRLQSLSSMMWSTPAAESHAQSRKRISEGFKRNMWCITPQPALNYSLLHREQNREGWEARGDGGPGEVSTRCPQSLLVPHTAAAQPALAPLHVPRAWEACVQL